MSQELLKLIYSEKGLRPDELVNSQEEINKLKVDNLFCEDVVYSTILTGCLLVHLIKKLLQDRKQPIDSKILMIIGKNDTVTLFEEQNRFAEILEKKFSMYEKVVFEGCKHEVHTDRMVDFQDVFGKFLSETVSLDKCESKLTVEARLKWFSDAQIDVQNCVTYEFSIFHVMIPVLVIGF